TVRGVGFFPKRDRGGAGAGGPRLSSGGRGGGMFFFRLAAAPAVLVGCITRSARRGRLRAVARSPAGGLGPRLHREAIPFVGAGLALSPARSVARRVRGRLPVRFACGPFARPILLCGLARPVALVSTRIGLWSSLEPRSRQCDRVGRPLPGGRVRFGPNEEEGPLRSRLCGFRLAAALRRIALGCLSRRPELASLGSRRGRRGGGCHRFWPQDRAPFGLLDRCGRRLPRAASALEGGRHRRRTLFRGCGRVEPRGGRAARLDLSSRAEKWVKTSWVQAERDREVRQAARAWHKAGVIDDGALSAIEALYPAPWPNVPPLWSA